MKDKNVDGISSFCILWIVIGVMLAAPVISFFYESWKEQSDSRERAEREELEEELKGVNKIIITR